MLQQNSTQQGTEKLVHGIHQLDDCVAAQQLGAVQQQRQAGAYHGLVKPLNGVQTAQHCQDQRKQGQMRQSGSGSSRNTGGHQIQQCHQAGFTAAVCQRAAGQHSSKGRQHGQSGDAAVQRGRTSLPQQIQRQRKPQGGIAEQGDDLSEDDKDKSVHGNLLLFYLQTVGLYLHTKKAERSAREIQSLTGVHSCTSCSACASVKRSSPSAWVIC